MLFFFFLHRYWLESLISKCIILKETRKETVSHFTRRPASPSALIADPFQGISAPTRTHLLWTKHFQTWPAPPSNVNNFWLQVSWDRIYVPVPQLYGSVTSVCRNSRARQNLRWPRFASLLDQTNNKSQRKFLETKPNYFLNLLFIDDTSQVTWALNCDL